jgi:hypothetical protein
MELNQGYNYEDSGETLLELFSKGEVLSSNDQITTDHADNNEAVGAEAYSVVYA